MRRLLIRVTLASIAVAAAMLLSRPTQPPEHRAFTIQLGPTHVLLISRDDLRRLLSDDALRRWDADLRSLMETDVRRIPDVDREISAMDCRIVAEERLSGDRFLLTEECAWKSGRVERRRFTALRMGDGPSQGWMYRLAESET